MAVTSQLNIRQWRHFLKDYHLNRLCEYLEFGFLLPLDYEKFRYNAVVENHASAVAFQQNIQDYLDTEIKHNVMLGPYKKWPFMQLHVLPVMMRPKADGTHRVTVDLSWPHGHSVNSCIPNACFHSMDFELYFPNVDHIV